MRNALTSLVWNLKHRYKCYVEKRDSGVMLACYMRDGCTRWVLEIFLMIYACFAQHLCSIGSYRLVTVVTVERRRTKKSKID